MSGGVDSSVAAAKLVEAGHCVFGFTLRLFDHDPAVDVSVFPDPVKDAAAVCAELGIPHHVVDLRAEFHHEIMDYFEREYMAGRTPNPCVHCNSRIKWAKLWNKAQAYGIERISTGHYARIDLNTRGDVCLRRGADQLKDQSYFLWELPRKLLALTFFPLGDMTKTEVREYASAKNLPVAERSESQEVCFIPNNDYRAWLLNRRPDLANGELKGEMVNQAGDVIGRHEGFPFFTIGQRKGLGLGGGKKYYVTNIDPKTRRVQLGEETQLVQNELTIHSINRLQDRPYDGSNEYEVKIRYRDPGFPAVVERRSDDTLTICSTHPIRSVTPGQSAVIYDGDTVVAGGIIR